MKTAMDGQDRIGLKHFNYEGGRNGAQPGREILLAGPRVVDSRIVFVSRGGSICFLNHFLFC
jgi:hypothetical protein